MESYTSQLMESVEKVICLFVPFWRMKTDNIRKRFFMVSCIEKLLEMIKVHGVWSQWKVYIPITFILS